MTETKEKEQAIEERVKLRDVWKHLTINEDYLRWVEQVKGTLTLRGECDVEEKFETLTSKYGTIRQPNHYVSKATAKWIIAHSKKGEGMEAQVKVFDEAEETVSLRGVYQELGLSIDFNRWAKEQIVLYLQVESTKYRVSEKAGIKTKYDYFVPKSVARKIAVESRKEKGEALRDALIEQDGKVAALKSKFDKEYFKDFLGNPVAMNNLALALIEKNQELLPKAQAYDRFLNSDGLFYVKDVAKVCGWKQNEFFELLKIKKIIHWMGDHYQSCFGQDEHFRLVSREGSEGGKVYKTLMVTPQGHVYLCRRFGQNKAIGVVAGVLARGIEKEVAGG